MSDSSLPGAKIPGIVEVDGENITVDILVSFITGWIKCSIIIQGIKVVIRRLDP